MILVTRIGSTSPLTTKGDLFGYDTDDNRIPIGANDEILTADNAQALGLKWAAPAAPATAIVALQFGFENVFHYTSVAGKQYFGVAGVRCVSILPADTIAFMYTMKFAGSVIGLSAYEVVAGTGNDRRYSCMKNGADFTANLLLADGVSFNSITWAAGTYTFVVNDRLGFSCWPKFGYNNDTEDISGIVWLEVTL